MLPASLLFLASLHSTLNVTQFTRKIFDRIHIVRTKQRARTRITFRIILHFSDSISGMKCRNGFLRTVSRYEFHQNNVCTVGRLGYSPLLEQVNRRVRKLWMDFYMNTSCWGAPVLPPLTASPYSPTPSSTPPASRSVNHTPYQTPPPNTLNLSQSHHEPPTPHKPITHPQPPC